MLRSNSLLLGDANKEAEHALSRVDHRTSQPLDTRHLTRRQLKTARALVGLEQTDLAEKAAVAISTVRRMATFEGEVGARNRFPRGTRPLGVRARLIGADFRQERL
jgi:hypothetical protein